MGDGIQLGAALGLSKGPVVLIGNVSAWHPPEAMTDGRSLGDGASLRRVEGGIEGSLPKDIESARSSYEATCKAYVDEEGNKCQEMWTTVVMGMRQLIPSKSSTHHGQPRGDVTTDHRVWTPEIAAVKHLIPMDDWDTTDAYLVSIVVERFNWGLAGQAFLFGASVVMTQTPQPHHYPTLLPTLPVLGMTLAAFSMLQ